MPKANTKTSELSFEESAETPNAITKEEPIVHKIVEAPPAENLTPMERIERNKELIGVLSPIIKDHHLANIQGKNYMCVGGGIAVANAMGYAVSVSEVTYDKAMAVYQATAELRDSTTGVLVATAVGYVGDDEARWAKGPAYARLSMTQTRAEAKLLRANFGSVYVLLGASTDTPAEEMSGVVTQGGTDKAPPSPPRKKGEPKFAQADIIVDRVETKTGTSAAGNDWEIYLVFAVDGSSYSTFDSETRDKAMDAAISSESVTVNYEITEGPKGQVRQRITSLETTSSQGIPF
jgi:hypothetical protein